MRVLVACEFSGRVRNAFSKRGHEAWSCDLLASETPGNHIKGDVRDIELSGWDLVICHPPCTYIAVSGSRLFKEREEQQKEALEFVRWLMSWPVERFALENPVGVISTKIRKSDQIINPFQFGSPVSKKTCLWLTGLPKLQPTSVFKPSKCFTDGFKYSSKRWMYRSRTDKGIAKAMSEQWG